MGWYGGTVVGWRLAGATEGWRVGASARVVVGAARWAGRTLWRAVVEIALPLPQPS